MPNYSISTITNDDESDMVNWSANVYIRNIFIVCNYNPAHVTPVWKSFSTLNCLNLSDSYNIFNLRWSRTFACLHGCHLLCFCAIGTYLATQAVVITDKTHPRGHAGSRLQIWLFADDKPCRVISAVAYPTIYGFSSSHALSLWNTYGRVALLVLWWLMLWCYGGWCYGVTVLLS